MRRWLPLLLGLAALAALAPAGDAAAEDTFPSAREVIAALRPVRRAVQRCGAGWSGSVQMRVEFEGRTGRVLSATGEGGYSRNPPPPGVVECIAQKVRVARVPPFASPRFAVSFPFRFEGS